MKNFYKLEIFIGKFKTVNKTLAKLLGIAVLWVLLYDFMLVNMDEWYPKAAVVGLLTRNLCFAFITGFIFYFLNTHLSSHKTKVKTYRYIANKVAVLDDLSTNLILSLKFSQDLDNEGYDVPPQEEIKKWCKQIPRGSAVDYKTFAFSVSFSNWFELFNFINDQTKEIVKDLLLVRDSLDSETLRYITNIENCTSVFLNVTKGQNAGPRHSLEIYSFQIYDYRRMCHELTLHLKKEYEVYKKEYSYLEKKGRREKKAQKDQQQTQQQDIQS